MQSELLLSGGASGIGRPNGRLEVKDANGKKLLDEAYRLNSQGHALQEILGQMDRLGHDRPPLSAIASSMAGRISANTA